jgi:hypothetical protein
VFGHWQGAELDGVEIPELTAFLNELEDLFEKHGVGIDLDHGYGDERSKLRLVSYHSYMNHTDADLFIRDLEDYERGIAWLDEAKAKVEANRQERWEREMAEEEAEAAEQAKRNADKVLKEGLVLAGKRYRVVEEE